jgi:prophage maintenance system killer protein
MSAGLSFLLLNGKTISASIDEIEQVALLVADAKNKGYTDADLNQWLRKITRKRPVIKR